MQADQGHCHGTLGCGGYLGRRGGEDVRGGPSSEAVGDREDPPAREIANRGELEYMNLNSAVWDAGLLAQDYPTLLFKHSGLQGRGWTKRSS